MAHYQISSTYISNPWTGRRVSHEIDGTKMGAYINLLSEEEIEAVNSEAPEGATNEEWIETMVAVIGEDRAGHVILGS